MSTNGYHQPSPVRRENTVVGATTSNVSSSSTTSNSSALRSVFTNVLRGNFPSSGNGSSGNNNNGVFPEMQPLEKRLEKHSYRLAQIRITPLDVQRVTNDPEQFTKLQESLRQRHCMTDAMIRQTYYDLIKDRVREMKPLSNDKNGSVSVISRNNSHTSHNSSNSNKSSLSFVPQFPRTRTNSVEVKDTYNNGINKSVSDDSLLQVVCDNNSDKENNNTQNEPSTSPTSVAMTLSLSSEQFASLHDNEVKIYVHDCSSSEDDDIQSQSD